MEVVDRDVAEETVIVEDVVLTEELVELENVDLGYLG